MHLRFPERIDHRVRIDLAHRGYGCSDCEQFVPTPDLRDLEDLEGVFLQGGASLRLGPVGVGADVATGATRDRRQIWVYEPSLTAGLNLPTSLSGPFEGHVLVTDTVWSTGQ